ncbi:MAG: hypothetical protein KIT16_17365, partial [Rhodospirillaceae bacterium]|nr:hypothetical protein [Rhodospirillaceae bacterium]
MGFRRGEEKRTSDRIDPNAILFGMAEGIAAVGDDWGLVYTNPAAALWLGSTPDTPGNPNLPRLLGCTDGDPLCASLIEAKRMQVPLAFALALP